MSYKLEAVKVIRYTTEIDLGNSYVLDQISKTQWVLLLVGEICNLVVGHRRCARGVGPFLIVRQRWG